jgi:hypothetical protein
VTTDRRNLLQQLAFSELRHFSWDMFPANTMAYDTAIMGKIHVELAHHAIATAIQDANVSKMDTVLPSLACI